MPTESTPLPELPPIPAKRYFTIGEVSELCLVKPHVLRYWEQEFSQLRPVKRRGNRRYYQHHEVLLVRRIRELLYGEGFTIIGARGRLDEQATGGAATTAKRRGQANATAAAAPETGSISAADTVSLKKALLEIAALLGSAPKA
jgi:DNA-binding transcriptional MerR regulator